MKATIFLDIDGVLTTNAEFMRSRTNFWKKHEDARILKIPYPFNPGCVKVFNDILEITDAEIVLSSDWRRYFTLEDLEKIFKFNKVIKSPMGVTEIQPCSFSMFDKNRAHEIELYVNKYKLEKYVIIDDLDLEYFCSVEHFVKTTDREGIKQLNIKQKILKVLE